MGSSEQCRRLASRNDGVVADIFTPDTPKVNQIKGKRSPLSYVVQSLFSLSFDALPSSFLLLTHLYLHVAAPAGDTYTATHV